jgi:ABC-2 type transport system ATP-binding protein
LTEPVLSLSRVSKRLGSRTVLKEVSFDVERGDIFGYLGPNGAGKTTSIRVLLGLFRPDEGKASLLGRDISIDETRKRIGFVLESDGLYDNLDAIDNLAYYGSIYGVAQPLTRIDEVLTLVNLKDRGREKISAYSRGMRQRLALARALLHNPDILILDEPTAGVDPTGQIEVRELMLDMARKQGKTILFSSHNLDEVQRICNRVALINRGSIQMYGRLDELQRSMGGGEIVIETTAPLAEPFLEELRKVPGLVSAHTLERNLTLSLDRNKVDVPRVVAYLSERGAGIEQVIRKEASLEDMYMAILKEPEAKA